MQGVSLPAFNALAANWFPSQEKSCLFAICLAGMVQNGCSKMLFVKYGTSFPILDFIYENLQNFSFFILFLLQAVKQEQFYH